MHADNPPQLFTIGHSTHPLADFLDLLAQNRIEAVADVRAHPGSRRYPHFNKEALAQSIRDAGLAYHHMKSLGGRRKRQEDPDPNNPWRNASFANYADYTRTDAFRAALGELEQMAREKRVAIMCAETLWWKCHRRIIADEAARDGFAIVHIMPEKHAAARAESPELPGL